MTRRSIDEELAFHLAALEDELVAGGSSRREAALEARRRFGDVGRVRAACLELEGELGMFDRCMQGGILAALVALGALGWLALNRVLPERDAALVAAVDSRIAALDARLAQLAGALRDGPRAERPATWPAPPAETGPATDPDRLLALNRAGEWSEAAALAERMLASSIGDADVPARAQVLLSLAYSRTRLGDGPGAAAALDGFAAVEGQLPDEHWIREWARTVRAETADAGVSAGPPDADPWPIATPEESGLDPAFVEAHRALCEETGADACLVVHRGRIVSEWTGPDYRLPVYAMSSTKSITSLLVGCLIDDGLLEGIDVPVGRYLPEWAGGARADVTLRHLLSHTSGLPRLGDESVGFVSDKNAFVRALEPSAPPGTAFAYSNEAVQLLSPVLDEVAGEPIQDYARRRLFEPLGMGSTRLQLDAEGHAWTYADMNTTPRDLARIGQLMLQRGSWSGRRIVSERWIDACIRPSQPLREDCGLLWWLHSDPAGFAALGYLHTDVHVFPDAELVLVRTQSKLAPGAPYPDYRERALELVRALER